MKNLMSIFLLVCVFSASYGQHDHSTHAATTDQKSQIAFKDEKLTLAYSQYVTLKEALVSSNAGDAKKAASALTNSLAALTTGKKALDAAKEIAASDNLQAQRKSFSALSNEMTTLVKAAKISAGSIYVAYCPMANDDEGAFWLSNEKAIRNPYFGDMMLKCGSVKETLQ